jgi:hypothetical protein
MTGRAQLTWRRTDDDLARGNPEPAPVGAAERRRAVETAARCHLSNRQLRSLLASSTDGVGTELAVAQAMDKHDTVGFGEVVSSKRSRRLECSAAPGRCCFLDHDGMC